MSGPKHFQLVVPNYDQSGDNPGSPLSYFRMGADFQDDDVEPPAGSRGDELLTGFAFNDDIRTPTYPGKVYVRDDGVDRTTGGVDFRTALTDELVSRGGWRDHTDGNRISTTRGDVVDVVRGNYKLVVLGRVTHHWDGDSPNPNVGRTRWESSGGHNNESTSTPGEVISIFWSENEDGTWRAIEQTEKGDVQSHFYGRIEEHYFGPTIITTVGVGTSATGCYGGLGTAQAAQRPDIEEDTYAQSITSTDTIDLSDETLDVSGTLSDSTHILGSKTSNETAPTHTSIAKYAFFKEELHATNLNVTDYFKNGWRRNLTFGGAAISMSFVGVHLAAKAKVRFGLAIKPYVFSLEGSLSLEMRAFLFTGVHLGKKIEMGFTGYSGEFNLMAIDLIGSVNRQYLTSIDGETTRLYAKVNNTILAAFNSDN